MEQLQPEKISSENPREKDSPTDLISKYSQLQKLNIQIEKQNTDLKQ